MTLHRKKMFTSFPSPAGMSQTKLPLGRNNSVITSLFPPRESLVVTSRLGTGNSLTFFYGVCTYVGDGLRRLFMNILYSTVDNVSIIWKAYMYNIQKQWHTRIPNRNKKNSIYTYVMSHYCVLEFLNTNLKISYISIYIMFVSYRYVYYFCFSRVAVGTTSNPI